MPHFHIYANTDALRDDSRFKTMLKKMNLKEFE
jgi:hypothetical protein